jgi:hypothetical protein
VNREGRSIGAEHTLDRNRLETARAWPIGLATAEPAPTPAATPRDALVNAINARFGRRTLTRAATLKTGD